jgi:SAM-dependent methyltransferase
MSGFIGGSLGYHLLRRVGRKAAREGVCDGSAYQERSKLEVLFGPGVWDVLADKTVVDFGCGIGAEAIDMATRGKARRVVGIDIREDLLEIARHAAAQAGVADRCFFATEVSEPADVVVSLDGFEHYDDPAGVLKTMRHLLRDEGVVLNCFGPPWFHPYGGHLFSVFPWAHLIFTEPALIRWRSDFKSGGARRFNEVQGGLNQMTVRKFRELVAASDFDVQQFEAVPIGRLRRLSNAMTRELFTSVVRCTLVARRTPSSRLPNDREH